MRAYREKIKRPHLYQLRELALAFTFCGGFIDAYTFTERGGTLAAGQTGNIIFFGTDIAKHDLPGLTTKVATFLAYILGLIVVTTIALKVKSKYKRIFCILPIMFISLVVGFVTMLADKATGGSGVAGAAISSTAASAVANPSALAEVDAKYAAIAPTAAAQIAASVIITSFLTPLFAGWVYKRNQKKAAK